MFGYKLRTLSESIGNFANLFRSLNGYLSSSPITKDLIFLSCISTYLVCNSFRIAIFYVKGKNGKLKNSIKQVNLKDWKIVVKIDPLAKRAKSKILRLDSNKL